MRAFASDDAEVSLPPGHPFPISKYARLRRLVVAEALAEVVPAAAATFGELALAHDADYVRRVFSGRLTPLEVRRIGFPWSPELVERSRRSVGATVAAARAALQDRVAVALAGGTHHARRDSGAGYCVFNDVVVALHVLRRERRVRRALVVDCDVHQGDGTASLLRDDPEAFAFSIHGAGNFPLRKVDGDLDVALPDGTTDETYLEALAPALAESLERARAEIAFFLAGADPFAGDRWGRLALSKEGLARRDRLVISSCLRNDLPVAVVMAGGYAPAVDDIVDIHAATVRIAAELSSGALSAPRGLA